VNIKCTVYSIVAGPATRGGNQ